MYIEWDEPEKCLKISSPALQNAEQSIVAAIKGIHQAVHDCLSSSISASPKYLIQPPRGNVTRSIVRPTRLSNDPMRASHFELVGKELTEEQQLAWGVERAKVMHDNRLEFEVHLKENLLKFAALKGWMRMRVHFGHLALNRYKTTFAESSMGFKEFVEMVNDRYMSTKFDKR